MNRKILNLNWFLAAALALVLAGCDSAAKFNNTDITGSALTADNFKLKDLSGKERTMDSYEGQVVAMFFGYTNCPDACPITLQQLAAVKQELTAKADGLQVLFVSVDPERDTPELLRQYVPQFHPSFNALTGSMEELKPLLEGMRVYHAKSGDTESDNYLVDHSSSVYIFDKNGNPRLFVRHNSDPEPLAQDILTLINEST
ncbi:MAG: SCO family protein [Limnobacter sp.]|nr:SCO family protein [Limnobacter sp.]